MAPRSRGIAAHFASSGKASLARAGSVKGSNGTSKAKSTRTRLRTPEAGEVDRIIAETQTLTKAEPVQDADAGQQSASTAAAIPNRLTTPEELVAGSSQGDLLGTPPPLSSTDLLDPTQRSPISVRTDPDSGKMFLMMPARPSSNSSPTKRKATTTPPHPTSPSKTPKRTTRDAAASGSTSASGTRLSGGTLGRRLISGEHESPPGVEHDDGLVLTPGRAKGTRIALGSPHKSPLASRHPPTAVASSSTSATVQSPSQSVQRHFAALEHEQDEDEFLTPRSVRQRPKGLPLPPLATQKAAAIFRSAHQSTSASSTSRPTAPSLARASDVFDAPSHIAATTTESRDANDKQPEDDVASLPQPKHELSHDLPLPPYYSSLMTLHVALEHALVVHLATAGCSSATLEMAGGDQDADDLDGPDTWNSTTPMADGLPRQSTHQKTVRLPNLISYSALRPLVERSGGRRLGPTELRRLAHVWLDFQQQQPSDDAPVEEVRGLGFIISKTRTMDQRTGRRTMDWGIGIELEIKRVHRERTPPPQVGFAGVEVKHPPSSPSVAQDAFDPNTPGTPKAPGRCRFTTPPPSPSPAFSRSFGSPSTPKTSAPRNTKLTSSPSLDRHAVTASSIQSPKIRSSLSHKAREGMSVVAMWNNGLELRKAEVGRRLRHHCARYHQLWLDEKGISVPPPPPSPGISRDSDVVSAGPKCPATPSIGDSDDANEERKAVMGAGGLLTPSATRSGGRRAGKRTFALDASELDRDGLADSESEAEGDPDVTIAKDGRLRMMQELDQPGTRTLRASQSTLDPVSRQGGSTVTSTLPSKVGEGELPAEGQVLVRWHPEFDVNDASVVRPVSLAVLPSLSDPPALTGAAGGFSTPHRRSKQLHGLGIGTDGEHLPETPKKPVRFRDPAIVTRLQLDGTAAVGPESSTPQPAKPLSLRDRIKAKEELRRSQSLPSLSSSSSSSSTVSKPGPVGSSLGERAIVSRLPEISSILMMLFSNGLTSTSTGVLRSPVLSLSDTITKLVKSLKIQLSRHECSTALQHLAVIVPGCIEIFPDPQTKAEFIRLGKRNDGCLFRLADIHGQIHSHLRRHRI